MDLRVNHVCCLENVFVNALKNHTDVSYVRVTLLKKWKRCNAQLINWTKRCDRFSRACSFSTRNTTPLIACPPAASCKPAAVNLRAASLFCPKKISYTELWDAEHFRGKSVKIAVHSAPVPSITTLHDRVA